MKFCISISILFKYIYFTSGCCLQATTAQRDEVFPLSSQLAYSTNSGYTLGCLKVRFFAFSLGSEVIWIPTCLQVECIQYFLNVDLFQHLDPLI